MTAIFERDEQGWRLAQPVGFGSEAALHDLVELAPQLLPLSGEPVLVMLGREVRFGSGFADLLAVETSGRPVIIEIKLRQNSESRRAVVAQVLSYAAGLRQLSIAELDALISPVANATPPSTVGLVEASDQAGGFDASRFEQALSEHLAAGSFRIVLVLDQTPAELVQVVGYLETVAPGVVIDLITISQYRVGGSDILVPQRVDPQAHRRLSAPSPSGKDRGYLVAGPEDFRARAEQVPEPARSQLLAMTDWTEHLAQEGLARLSTFHGVGDRRLTLLPRLQAENVGLVTIWNDNGRPGLQFWRGVFERLARESIGPIEAQTGEQMTQGSMVAQVDDQLLQRVEDAYRIAAGARLAPRS